MTTTAKKLKRKAKKLAKKALKKVEVSPKTEIIAVKGAGDYVPTRFARLKGKGGYISDALGALGSKAGGWVGDKVESGLSSFARILGFGDYRKRAANHQAFYKQGGHSALMGLLSNPDPMKMGAMNAQFGGGPPRIQHREFIGPVYGSIAFKTTVYPIQPGLRGDGVLFPWLSSVAGSFQQYSLNGAILEFVSTSTEYSSSTVLGEVSMCTVYDAEAPPLASQAAVNNNEYTTFNKPSESFIHPIECARSENQVALRFVRSGNSLSATSDERLSDVGKFQISTVGQPVDGAQIGELWITYDVSFQKPVLPDIHMGTSYVMRSRKEAAGWDAGYEVNAGNSLPVQFDPTTGIFTLPAGYAGKFLMTIYSNAVESTAEPTTGWILTEVGSDITGVNWITTTGAYGNVFPLGGCHDTQQGMASWMFSTIAETPANNSFRLTPPNWASLGSGQFHIESVAITAVDNDILPFTPMVNGEQNMEAMFEKYLIKKGLVRVPKTNIFRKPGYHSSEACSSSSSSSACSSSSALAPPALASVPPSPELVSVEPPENPLTQSTFLKIVQSLPRGGK